MKQFIYHADQNGLLPVRQSAYRRFHSTESAVLVVHNDIVRAYDDGHVAARPQLSFRLCRPLHSTVNPTIQVFRHQAAARVVPFIPNWTYAGVYHQLWPNSSNTDHVGCATRLESWSSTIHIIHRIYNRYLFLTLRSIPHVCRRHTVSPTVTVQYLRFLH